MGDSDATKHLLGSFQNQQQEASLSRLHSNLANNSGESHQNHVDAMTSLQQQQFFPTQSQQQFAHSQPQAQQVTPPQQMSSQPFAGSMSFLPSHMTSPSDANQLIQQLAYSANPGSCPLALPGAAFGATSQPAAASLAQQCNTTNPQALMGLLNLLQQNIGALQALVPLLTNGQPSPMQQLPQQQMQQNVAQNQSQLASAASAGVVSAISQLATATASLLPQLGAAVQLQPGLSPGAPVTPPQTHQQLYQSSQHQLHQINQQQQQQQPQQHEHRQQTFQQPHVASTQSSQPIRVQGFQSSDQTGFQPVQRGRGFPQDQFHASLGHAAEQGQPQFQQQQQETVLGLSPQQQHPAQKGLVMDPVRRSSQEDMYPGGTKTGGALALASSLKPKEEDAGSGGSGLALAGPGSPEGDEVDDGVAGEDFLTQGSHEIIEMDPVEILAEHTHFCEICGKGFKRDANLRMHMRGHGDEYKTPSALARPDKQLIDQLDLQGNKRLKRYSCPYVGCKRNKQHKRFIPLKTMLCVKNHYRRSHCPKMLTCSKCGSKRFSVVADLRTHEKHCGKDRWLCSCGTTFSRKDKLLGHLALFVGHSAATSGDEDVGQSAGPRLLAPDNANSTSGGGVCGSKAPKDCVSSTLNLNNPTQDDADCVEREVTIVRPSEGDHEELRNAGVGQMYERRPAVFTANFLS